MESIKLSSSGQLCCWITNDSRKKSKSDDAETLISDGFHRRRQKDRKFLIEQAIPPILAIGLYSNSLGGDFVHDDLSAITSNPDVTGYHPEEGTSWDFLHNDFWGTSLLDPRSHKSYRPFTVLTFRWNYFWSGLNPWSYHAVNVLLHAFVCWLLHEWLCRRCFRLSRTTSLLTSSLFALHPVHTEAVSGIVGRADILATLFFLLSFICHDRATSCKSLQRQSSAYLLLVRAVSLLSALLALAAKENGIAALPVAIVWDVIRLTMAGNSTEDSSSIKSSAIINNNIRFWKSKRIVKKRLLRWRNSFYRQFKEHFYLFGPILLSVLMTLALLVGRISLQQGQMPVFSEQDNPAAFASSDKSRILTLLYLPAFNMGLLLAPVLLSYDWQNGSIPLIESCMDMRNAGSIFLYASLILAVLYSWTHRQKAILWSIAVMVLPMLPASNLFYPCGFVVAERLLYLPSLGYCLIVAIGLGRIVEFLARHHHRSTAAVVISCRRMSSTAPAVVPQERPVVTSPKRLKVLLLIGTILTVTSFAAKTWTRNADWKDRKTLFRSGLESLPNNAKMHYNYANVQKDDGHWETAIHHYRQAIQLWPNYPSALNNLGTVLLAQAEEMDNKDEAGGNIFLRQDSELVREAEGRFREAIRAHPHHVHAHYNLAIIHMQRNETDLAIRLLSRCIQLNPEHREAVGLLNRIQLPLAEEGRDPETGIVAAGQEKSVSSLLESRNVSREPQRRSRTDPSAVMGEQGGSSQIDCSSSSSSSRRWINMNAQDDRSSRERRREFLPRGCPNNNYRWNKTA